MAKSLKQIVQEFKDLCNAHDQLRSVEYGEILDIIKRDQVEYAAAFLNIVQMSPMLSQNKLSYSLEILVLDRVFKGDEEHKVDVENNTNQILIDLINVIFYSDKWQAIGDFSIVSPARKYYDRSLDQLTGWGISINVDVVSDQIGICDLPITGYDYND